jgi:hypothetical protein
MAKKKIVNENELSVQITNEVSSSENDETEAAKPKAKAKAKAKAKVGSSKKDNTEKTKMSEDAEAVSSSSKAKPKAKAKTKAKNNSDVEPEKNASSHSDADSESGSESDSETKKKMPKKETSSSSMMSSENKKMLKNISTNLNTIAKAIKNVYMKNVDDNFDIKKTKNVFKVDSYLFLYALSMVKNNDDDKLPSCLKNNKDMFLAIYELYELIGQNVAKMQLFSNTELEINIKDVVGLSNHVVLAVLHIYVTFLAQHLDKANTTLQLKKFMELTELITKQQALFDNNLFQYIKKDNVLTKLKELEHFNKFDKMHL